MPNTIKYSGTTESNALNKGNWYIGTGDTGKGSSDSTGYWAGVDPPAGGYTIYQPNENIFGIRIAKNNNECIGILKEYGYTGDTIEGALLWSQSQDDILVVNSSIDPIVTDGLVLYLDSGYVSSYPRTGTTWSDLSGNGNNGTLTNGPTFDSSNLGSIVFDGSNDYVDFGSDIFFKSSGGWTVESWVNFDFIPTTYNNITSPANFIGSETITHNSWYWSVLQSKLALWNRSPGVWKYGSTVLQAYNWYNTVLVCDNSGTSYQMYLNGIAEGGNHTTYTWNAAYSGLNIRYIGRGNSSNIRQLNGKIPITKVYNRALTPQEILQNYNATKSRYGL